MKAYLMKAYLMKAYLMKVYLMKAYDESIPDESVPDEGYSRNVLCTLNLISVFLLKIHIECDSIPSHI
jgi:hypothetical protein